MQDPVRGRQPGQGVRDRLLTEDPASEALGIEDAALPRQAFQDEQEPERQQDRRPPPHAHQGEDGRGRGRRREDGYPQAQLRPQEFGRFPTCTSHRSVGLAGESPGTALHPNQAP